MLIPKLKFFLRESLYKYIYSIWNIGLMERDPNLDVKKIRWLKHNYKDRWFADPFIIGETAESFIILAEEYIISKNRGRIARLIVSKNDFKLIQTTPILENESHFSFPNFINLNNQIYLYPENIASGKTKIYKYNDSVEDFNVLLNSPLADPVIFYHNNYYYLLGTKRESLNGNLLSIYRSSNAFIGYKEFQTIEFKDNIARRAGNVFVNNNQIISPAQICNTTYGEGISLQLITFENDKLVINEIKRIYPFSKEYKEGFHTYNVFKNVVIVDGYKYRYKNIHNLYFKLRGFKSVN